MSKVLNFQGIIMKLQEYWATQGCLIWQPYYTQVGAGTMNPATALRVLGPEPWRVAYVEPSIRPDDGRYGENPNRMQMHYQMQVILKPDPGHPQEIYLRSLAALGIDPHQHDIRFVEDNWESPALGAWGLGWEVWLDGQEITQYTYFQQAGGVLLDPVSVEITYGLERIAIALQHVNSFREIQWSPTLTDGDVNLQAEQEHSRYYFEVADVERLRQMYDLFEAEARACLERQMVLPAHDYVLKCSHTFNVLDTRGAIGVTDRQAYFGRMRDLSRRVAEAYLEQRQRLEYPWLVESSAAAEQAQSALQIEVSTLETPADFLLEVGTEELPYADLNTALAQLEKAAPSLFADLRLAHGEIQVQGTPRRLVVLVRDLVHRQTDFEQLVKGPPAGRAFAADGTPTRAAEGFARSKGLAVTDLEVREMDGGEYVVAKVFAAGRPAAAVLVEALPNLLAGLRFDKSMRWNHTNVPFSRPVRWLLALHGEQVIPLRYAGLVAGRTTRGLRISQVEEHAIASPLDYSRVLQAEGITLDVQARRGQISAQVAARAKEVGGEVLADESLLAEVTNLVEAPTALRGTFDPTHLELPHEVLVSVMKKHQRYFPVQVNGRLLPYFITVANKPLQENGLCVGAETIISGNEHVIRARFTDAAYFVREDRKRPLESYREGLRTLTFQVKLGSMLDKTQRIRALVDRLGVLLALPADELTITQRAAELCKADLATQMVVDMTSLQGVMGRYYALESGESLAVASAIEEHYLPRYAGDAAPQTRPGLVLGLADRLDSLAGLFAAGLAPTGNKDPFAQRRAAVGIMQSLIAWDVVFDLQAGLDAAVGYLPIPASPESQAACLEFLVERLRNLLLEQGWRYDVVETVLAAQGANPARAARAVKQLAGWVERQDWERILPAYARCVRITRSLKQTYPVAEALFAEQAEKELFAALVAAELIERPPGNVDDFLRAFTPLIQAINHFFDAVLVMAEDEAVRHNRLGLLQRITALADGVADLSHLEGF